MFLGVVVRHRDEIGTWLIVSLVCVHRSRFCFLSEASSGGGVGNISCLGNFMKLMLLGRE